MWSSNEGRNVMKSISVCEVDRSENFWSCEM